MAALLPAVQIFLLVCLFLLVGVRLLTAIASFFHIAGYARARSSEHFAGAVSGFEPPVSIIVPVHNEEARIVSLVDALLDLTYPEFEIIVIDDGSDDDTLNNLIGAFSLAPFPEACRVRLPANPVEVVYHSTEHNNLRVIYKRAVNEADAINIGINVSRYPLFAVVRAGEVMTNCGLARLARPFLEFPDTIVSASLKRTSSGCLLSGGDLARIELPERLAEQFLLIDYLRDYFCSRRFTADHFAIFNKQAAISAGGFRHSARAAELDLLIRMHGQGHMSIVPEPVCWREPSDKPDKVQVSIANRQRALLDAYWRSLPPLEASFKVVLAGLLPVIELAGYIALLTSLIGSVPGPRFLAAALIVTSSIVPAVALLVEESLLSNYLGLRQVVSIFCAGLAEYCWQRPRALLTRVGATLGWLMSGVIISVERQPELTTETQRSERCG